MSPEDQPKTEQRVKVKDFRAVLRGFQKAFEGYKFIPPMFAPVPIAEEKTSIERITASNGIYTIERSESLGSEFPASKGYLQIVVKRAPLPGDNSFESETITLADGLADEVKQGEIDKKGKAKLVRRIIVGYVRLAKKSPEELASAQKEAEETGGGTDQITDAYITSRIGFEGIAAWDSIQKFIEGIRMSNPNLSKKLTRRTRR